MAKKIKKGKKKSKKTVSKKGRSKQSTKKISQELVIRVQSQDIIPTEKDIVEPIHEGKRYAITPTWVSTNQIMRMVQKTPREHIYTRPGKGGQKWNYVTGNYVEKVLNYVFGFMWDFEVVSHGQQGDFIWVQGKLTVKNSKGQTISKTQFGRKEIAFKKDMAHKPENMLDYGNDLKSATTDALKKCASMLGIASDIYGKTEFKEETGKDPLNSNSPKAPTEGTVKGPDEEPVLLCQKCDGVMSQPEADFSKRIFNGKQFCRDCQKEMKRK